MLNKMQIAKNNEVCTYQMWCDRDLQYQIVAVRTLPHREIRNSCTVPRLVAKPVHRLQQFPPPDCKTFVRTVASERARRCISVSLLASISTLTLTLTLDYDHDHDQVVAAADVRHMISQDAYGRIDTSTSLDTCVASRPSDCETACPRCARESSCRRDVRVVISIRIGYCRYNLVFIIRKILLKLSFSRVKLFIKWEKFIWLTEVDK